MSTTDEHERKKEKRFALYDQAIELWGMDKQMNMAVEEAAELINAIQKFRRRRCGPRELIDEIADTRIMLEQLHLMVGILDEEIEAAVDAKIKRLAQRVLVAASKERTL